jgi:hypothetical protein
LRVADGQPIEHVDFALPRTGSISSQLTDEVGDSVAGVLVFARCSDYWQGRRQLVPVGQPANTDGSGRFRIAHIAPGDSFVRAVTRQTWTVTRAGRKDAMSFLSTYYPGTSSVATAQPISVGIGQQLSNIDFQMTAGRTATLSGTAVDSHGQPLQNVIVGQEVIGPSGGTVGMAGSILPIIVTADVGNLAFVAAAGWSASGSIVTDTGVPPAIPRDRMRITASTANAFRMRMQGEPQFRSVINDDWTFSLEGIVGAAHLLVTLPDDWAVKVLDEVACPTRDRHVPRSAALQVC